jgi:ribosomal protein L37AE/L43A
MTTSYVCPDCDHRVVMVDGGGVWRTMLCRECNTEMQYDEDDASVEFVGHTEVDRDYRLSEAADEA